MKSLSLSLFAFNCCRWRIHLEFCAFYLLLCQLFHRLICKYFLFWILISPCSVQMQKNTDQKNSEYGHFWCSAGFQMCMAPFSNIQIFHVSAPHWYPTRLEASNNYHKYHYTNYLFKCYQEGWKNKAFHLLNCQSSF